MSERLVLNAIGAFIVASGTLLGGPIVALYTAIPCNLFADGCKADAIELGDGLIFNRQSATAFIRERGLKANWIGIMTPVDRNSSGWLVGQVQYHEVDQSSGEDWDRISGFDWPFVAEGQFIYNPDGETVCCLIDFPYKIYSIDDDGFVFSNGAYGLGLGHVSQLDAFSPHPITLRVIGPFSEELPYPMEFIGRNSAGVFFAGGPGQSTTGSPEWALVPAPEPSTLTLAAGAMLIFVISLRRTKLK